MDLQSGVILQRLEDRLTQVGCAGISSPPSKAHSSRTSSSTISSRQRRRASCVPCSAGRQQGGSMRYSSSAGPSCSASTLTDSMADANVSLTRATLIQHHWFQGMHTVSLLARTSYLGSHTTGTSLMGFNTATSSLPLMEEVPFFFQMYL